MSKELEIERTFILNQVPNDLAKYTEKHLLDIYLPASSDNPQIRLRQINDTYFLTKKYPKIPQDLSIMVEETIILSYSEFDYFRANLGGKLLEKKRYTYKSDDYILDLDVYLSDLSPLIILDIELSDINYNIDSIFEEFDILKEVTNNNKFAGGKMAGKKYSEIIDE